MPRIDRELEASISGIEYKLILRKGMRSIRMRMENPSGRVVVSASTRESRRNIDRFVLEHADWIRRRREAMASRPPRFPASYADGEPFSIWGAPMTLRVGEADGRASSCTREDGELFVVVPRGGGDDAVERAFKSFMRGELQRALDETVPRCERITGISCTRVQIRDMKTRWGSCTTGTGNIRIALRLASYPPECLMSVLIHELTHIRFAGHDDAFYGFMDACYPQWRAGDALLKE